MGVRGTSVVAKWPRAQRRSNLARWLAKCDGNLLTTAYQLGIHRSHLYRLIKEHHLWPAVNELRRRKIVRDNERRKQKYRGGIHV